MSDRAREFSGRERHLVLLASCLAIFVTPLMGSMVNLALSSIGTDFGIGAHDQGWITTSYFLSSVVFLVPFARLSDLMGKRRIFIAGLAITSAGAAMASFSPDIVALIACRVVMGAGGAAISCTGIAMISEVYPRNERGGALGINTAMVYAGSSLGPVLGGALVDSPLGWHSTFYMVIPFCVLAFFAVSRFKTDFAAAKGEPFDIRGALLFGIGVAAVTYGMMSIPDPYAMICIPAGLAVLVLFYVMQKRETYPVLNVRVFAYSKYTRSVVTTLLNYGSSFAVSFFVALYLQNVYGLSASQAGAVMLAQPVIQTLFTPFTGKLSDKMDDRILPTLGMIVTTIGLAMVLTFSAERNMLLVISALVVLGFGYALFSAPNTNSVMSSVNERLYSEAAATLSIMRQSGILVSMGIAAGCISLFMGNAVISENTELFMNSLRAAFTICVAMCIAGTVLSWFRGKRDAFTQE